MYEKGFTNGPFEEIATATGGSLVVYRHLSAEIVADIDYRHDTVHR